MLAFVGDAACNMGHSYLLGGATAGMHVRVSGPAGFEPDPEVLLQAQVVAQATGGSVAFVADPVEAVTGAGAVATDTWVSMGREDEAEARVAAFAPWSLDEELLSHAADDAVVLHCLPAYRGKEISAAVLDGPRSVVWDEAENRRHAQKAVMAWLLESRAGECS